MSALVLQGLLGTQVLAGEVAPLSALHQAKPMEVDGLLREWRSLVTDIADLEESKKLRLVNSFFNERISFVEDIDARQQRDYWATPLETLTAGSGDCEDFAIAKYFTLLTMGVSPSRLRLVYAKLTQTSQFTRTVRGHMVLAYYPTPHSSPLVMDNSRNDVEQSDKRVDLDPVFSFSLNGQWLGTGKHKLANSVSRWQDLVVRARRDGSFPAYTRTLTHLAKL